MFGQVADESEIAWAPPVDLVLGRETIDVDLILQKLPLMQDRFISLIFNICSSEFQIIASNIWTWKLYQGFKYFLSWYFSVQGKVRVKGRDYNLKGLRAYHQPHSFLAQEQESPVSRLPCPVAYPPSTERMVLASSSCGFSEMLLWATSRGARHWCRSCLTTLAGAMSSQAASGYTLPHILLHLLCPPLWVCVAPTLTQVSEAGILLDIFFITQPFTT